MPDEVTMGLAASDSEGVSTDQLADALATAQVDAAHQLEAEASIERAEATATDALALASEASTTAVEARDHSHSEYEHSHDDLHSRLSALEEWRSSSVAAQESAQQQETVEEIPPVEESTSAEVVVASESHADSQRHGLRRGR